MERSIAEKLLVEAKNMNKGTWVEHSYNVAHLAERIAQKAGMDSEKAYILGLLHDIGRRNGNMQARHAIDVQIHYMSRNEILKSRFFYIDTFGKEKTIKTFEFYSKWIRH